MESREQQLTEYERRRLENIKRNDEMMASLKIQSRLSELSAVSESSRAVKKAYKQSPEKKLKSETPIVIRRSLRARGMPPDSSGLPNDFEESPRKKSKVMMKIPSRQAPFVRGPVTVSDAYEGDDSYRPFFEKFSSLATMCQAGGDNRDGSSDKKRRSLRVRSYSNLNANAHESDLSYSPIKVERITVEHPIDMESLRLETENIARVVPGRILIVRFLPSMDMRIIVAANKYGNLGFWDLKGEDEDGNGIYLFRPHSAPVSGISVQPFSLSKMYTSCYDGLLRLMDIEKEMFELVYSSNSGSALFSLSQQPNNANSICFGEGQGGLNMFDSRVGKICSSWSLHDGRINSIDFSPAASNVMATSSTDGLACIWDLRKMDVKQPKSKSLQTVNHRRAVHSAYFSPSGSCLATTSLDDSIGVLQGANFEDMFMIHHDNRTNRWLSSFRAVWGWDDAYLYVGNMKRRVDVVSVSQRKTVYALDSPMMSAIPCRFDAHPHVAGMLAGATSGGQVYVWTLSS